MCEISPHTVERYKLSVKVGNRRYKVFAHQVLEDETLSVELRSQPREQHVLSGSVEVRSGELMISPNIGSPDGRAHHVHYHPSGRLRIKAFDNTLIRELSFPPLPLLHRAVPLFLLSVASVTQLDEDERTSKLGDHLVDLDQMPVRRLQCVAWIGPKGSLSALSPESVPAQKILYEDAGLYDVAYIIGEGIPISGVASHGCFDLRDTRITGVPAADILSAHSLPIRGPEYWASPTAIARQVRAALEHTFENAKYKLAGGMHGAWEVRMSLCKDGFIVALDWNHTWSIPGYSLAEFFEISVADVLGLLGVGAPDSDLKDVDEINSKLTRSLPKTCFVRIRSNKAGVPMHNAVVLLPNEHMRDRYYRIPRAILRNLAEIICLVDSDSSSHHTSS